MSFDPKMAKTEHVKHTKDGLDVWQDIFEYARLGFGMIPEEQFAAHALVRNLSAEAERRALHVADQTARRTRHAAPAAVIGELTNRRARGFSDITTRQDIQLHWLSIEDFPEGAR